ncbi:MAG: YitT family protein [Candidatus Dadabacteria bacterium]
MNPFLSIILSLRNNKTEREINRSAYRLAKEVRELKRSALQMARDSVLILLGIFSAAFGLEGFLLPSNFIDGGATGISLLITEVTSLPLPIILILVNIPFLVLGFQVVNRQFAIKAALSITSLAIVIALIKFPQVTDDKLLVAVFGGFFLGAGIGLSIRGGSVLDGTEVLAIFFSRNFKTTIGDIIIIINILVFLSAAYLLSVEVALYSMLTYLSASKTLDFVIEGIEEYTGVTIISPKNERIRRMIIEELGRGVTIYSGKSGFGTSGETRNVDIVYTVVTRLEVSKLSSEVEKIDSGAFVIMSSIKDTKGGMIKKRRLKH